MEFFKTYADQLTVLFAVCAGLFAFIKWIDSRNQALKNERYEKYIQLIKTLSGSRDNGGSIVSMTEQIAAVWLLVEYSEYYSLTLKILDNPELENMSNEPWRNFVLPQVRKVVQEIKIK